MQGPCFYINNFRATTITIATTTNNDLDQHEPAEKGAECQASDHNSIGSGCSLHSPKPGREMATLPLDQTGVGGGVTARADSCF